MTVMDLPCCIGAELDRVEHRFDHVCRLTAAPEALREVKVVEQVVPRVVQRFDGFRILPAIVHNERSLQSQGYISAFGVVAILQGMKDLVVQFGRA